MTEGVINLWVPMTDPYDLALIAKLGEEAAELAKACSRATMQGLDGTTVEQEGRSNGLEILREYTDCRAVMQLIGERQVIPEIETHGSVLEDRHWAKVKGFRRWMVLLSEALSTSR